MQPLGPITDAFRYINYGEAALWGVIGVGFVSYVFRSRGRARLLGAAAAVSFVAFGASDVVETRTGAWWHPWWLLVWKGACLCVFAWLLVEYARSRRRPD